MNMIKRRAGNQHYFSGDRYVSFVTIFVPLVISLIIFTFGKPIYSKESLQIKPIGFEKSLDYVHDYCWANLAHFDLNVENGALLMTTRISMGHVKSIMAFMLLNCLTFVGVEIFWWVGDMTRIPMTIDYFINGLEDGLLDLAMVLKSGTAKKASELFHRDNETRIQQAHGLDKSLIESNESLATLTKYDVHNTFETENMRAKYHQFEAFIQRVSKSQELVKTIFSRRIMRFTMLLIWQFIMYQVYLNPTGQLSSINCPLPPDMFREDASGKMIQSVQAIISSTSLRTSIVLVYFIVNTIVLITLPFCWCISCAAWRRGYNVLQHLPFGSGLADKNLKVSDLHFLMALAEANRTKHPCINVAFDALNTIPVKHQSSAFLSVYREAVMRALSTGNSYDYNSTMPQTPFPN